MRSLLYDSVALITTLLLQHERIGIDLFHSIEVGHALVSLSTACTIYHQKKDGNCSLQLQRCLVVDQEWYKMYLICWSHLGYESRAIQGFQHVFQSAKRCKERWVLFLRMDTVF